MHALADEHPDNNPEDNQDKQSNHDNCPDNELDNNDLDNEEYPLADAARPYRNMLCWPVTTHGWAIWVLAGQGMESFVVPHYLGPAVLHLLTTHRLPHPVITIPGEPERWAFLTEPATGTHATFPLELASHSHHSKPSPPPSLAPPATPTANPSGRCHRQCRDRGSGQECRLPDQRSLPGKQGSLNALHLHIRSQ